MVGRAAFRLDAGNSKRCGAKLRQPQFGNVRLQSKRRRADQNQRSKRHYLSPREVRNREGKTPPLIGFYSFSVLFGSFGSPCVENYSYGGALARSGADGHRGARLKM